MIENEAREWVRSNVDPNEVIYGVGGATAIILEFVKHLEKEGCFDKLALHDSNCECYEGAWACKCSERRFGGG